MLRWAGLIGSAYNAKVEVLHVDWMDYPAYFLPSQANELAIEAKRNRETLNEKLLAMARENLGPNIVQDTSIVEGHPIEAILKYSEKRRFDLIVMGSHGRSGVARMRLGSVAENVVRQAAIPTLVVRKSSDEIQKPKISRVLCPVNFTEPGFRCIEMSGSVAAVFGAELVVMHSIEQQYADLEETRDHLCQSVPETTRNHCVVTESVTQGSAAEQILLTAREQSIDLIVLAAQHHPLLEFTTLGSTTERVMRHADSAVLVFPGQQ